MNFKIKSALLYILVPLLLLGFAVNSYASKVDIPQDIIVKLSDPRDKDIRNYYRAKVLNEYPETAEALTVNAYFLYLNKEDSDAEQIALLEGALKIDPNYATAAHNLSATLDWDKHTNRVKKLKRQAFNAALSSKSNYDDIYGMYYYFFLTERFPNDAEPFYQELVEKGEVAKAIVNLIDARKQYDNKRYLESIDILVNASGNIPLESVTLFYLSLDKHRKSKQLSRTQSIELAQKFLTLITESYNKKDVSASVAEYTWKKYGELLGELCNGCWNEKEEAYKTAYQLGNMHGSIDAYVRMLSAQEKTNEAQQVLTHASTASLDISVYKAIVHLAFYNGAIELADEFYSKIIKTLPENKSAVSYAIAYSNDQYRMTGDPAGAIQLLEDLLTSRELNSKQLRKVWLELANFELNRLDLEKARYWIDKYESNPGEPDNYSLSFRNSINQYSELLSQSDDFYRENPFVSKWDKELSGTLSLNVEFETNSAQIKPDSYSSLDAAAKLLLTEDAQKFLFEISGHTDSKGSDAVNSRLSKARAESVRKYFIQRHKIPPARLKSSGYGKRFPIANNDHEQGRKANRRVEIVPLGNYSAPIIAGTGHMSTSRAAFSSDGKLAVSGMEPLSLFDLNKGVRIGDLAFSGGDRIFSPNNRYLAVRSVWKDQWGVTAASVRIIDVKTRQIKSIYLDAYNTSLGSTFEVVWSPFSDEVALLSQYGYLYVIDIETGKVERSLKSAERGVGGQILWTPNGEHFVIGPAQSNMLEVYHAKTMKLQNYVEGVDWPHAMTFNPETNEIVILDNENYVTVVDYQRLKVKQSFEVGVSGKKIMSIPGSSRYIFDAGFGTKTLYVVDTKTEEIKPLYTGKGKRSPDFSVISSGELLIADEEEIRRYPNPLDVSNPSISVSSASNSGMYMFVHSANDLIATIDSEDITLWRISQGKLVDKVAQRGGTWVQLTQKHRLLNFDQQGKIYEFNLNTLSYSHVATLDFQPTDYDVIDGKVALTGVNIGSSYRKNPSTQGQGAILDTDSFRQISRFSFSLETNRSRSGALADSGVQGTVFSYDGKYVAMGTWINDQYTSSASENVYVFDANSGKQVNILNTDRAVVTLARNPDSKKYWLSIKNDVSSNNWDPINSENQQAKRTPSGQQVTTEAGNTLFYTENMLSFLGNNLRLTADIMGAYVDESKNLLLIYTKNNELQYRNAKTLEQYLTVSNLKNEEWLAHTEDGYFVASMGATDKVYWSFGDNYVPFSALEETKERPSLIQQRLRALFSGKEVETDNIVVEDDIVNPQFSLSIVNGVNQSTKQSQISLSVAIEKQSQSVIDPEVRFIVNQRKSRGFEEEVFFDDSEQITVTRSIPLVEGINYVDVEVYFKGARVLTETVKITRERLAESAQKRGDLWFFGVGVSEYANSLQNLDFAHRDALTLADAFKKQQGKLYHQVHTNVLVNDQATARDIRIQLNEFLADAKDDDQVVIFIAGHGVQDNSQQLYFVTHEADIKKPYTGMDMSVFRNFLDSRPLNQSVLFVMDICNSGSFDKEVTSRTNASELGKLLGQGTSTTVLASSEGAQLSYESDQFGGGHGAFTYALLEGLAGKADAEVGDEDSYVSLMELISYTKRVVPKLTNKAQKPYVAEVKNFSDYPIALSE